MRQHDSIHFELLNWASYISAGNNIAEYPTKYPRRPPLSRMYVSRGYKDDFMRARPNTEHAERTQTAYLLLRSHNHSHAELLRMRYILRMESKHIAKHKQTTPGYVDKLMCRARESLLMFMI